MSTFVSDCYENIFTTLLLYFRITDSL